jgi:hypothetical protein
VNPEAVGLEGPSFERRLLAHAADTIVKLADGPPIDSFMAILAAEALARLAGIPVPAPLPAAKRALAAAAPTTKRGKYKRREPKAPPRALPAGKISELPEAKAYLLARGYKAREGGQVCHVFTPFMLSPGSEFAPMEISKRTGLNHGIVATGVKRLFDHGVIKKASTGLYQLADA